MDTPDISKIEGLRILVIEDDTVSRIFLRELLTPTQAQIDYAKSGYEATQYMAKNTPPDIILLDLRLPDVDGVELAQKFLANNPNLTIIAQTAYVSVGQEERCKNAGIKTFLAKPLKKAQLIELLSQFAKEHIK
jgi:CheY-like chemotaxis protein